MRPPKPHPLDFSFPNDHSRQVDANYYIDTYDQDRHVDFLDLGAGPGRSFDRVKGRFKSFRWIGVDIEASGPVRSRTRTDCEFVTYDGIHLPFAADSFDLVYSRQVFEHVRYPEAVLREIFRVLRPGGHFVGSVSQLEPFHSESLWCFTYHGLSVIARDAGLDLREYRPGVDGVTLTLRNFFKYALKSDVGMFDQWIRSESLLNRFIELQLAGRGATHSEINRLKVHYAGHICFKFQKPVAG